MGGRRDRGGHKGELKVSPHRSCGRLEERKGGMNEWIERELKGEEVKRERK